jgi:hypothetical protein
LDSEDSEKSPIQENDVNQATYLTRVTSDELHLVLTGAHPRNGLGFTTLPCEKRNSENIQKSRISTNANRVPPV